MTEQDFVVDNQDSQPHPVTLFAYRLDTVPGAPIEAGGIDAAEASFWAERLQSDGWRQIGSILTQETVSISDMLRYSETGEQKQHIRQGDYIPGPLVLNGNVITKGIGLWTNK